MSAGYERNVFINCPFDGQYQPIFEAIIFAIYSCGYRPRSAKEFSDSGSVRNDGILELIKDCRLGIHDISETGLNTESLPRFNMPLELGYFIGAKFFGPPRQRRKRCLVLDMDRYRYQKFISDLAGHDIKAHDRKVDRAILRVRDWLRDDSDSTSMPGADHIFASYQQFRSELPSILSKIPLREDEMTYRDFKDIVEDWFQQREASPR